MNCAIRVSGLSRSFSRKAAIEAIDLEVPEGAVYALAGPRGAGKTTLLRAILHILAPSSGRAEVLGTDSRHLGPREFQQIAYLSPDQELPEGMTVGHYLRFLSGFYPSWDDGLASHLVRRFQLPLDRRFTRLSEHTRRKAALVSSLACHPRLMVLDEPFRGVDRLTVNAMSAALAEYRESASAASVLMATEDAAEVEGYATHIGWIEGGRLWLNESLDTLRERYREIRLTFEDPPSLPEEWPAEWMAPEVGPQSIVFLDTRFDAERTPAEVRRLWPGLADLELNLVPAPQILDALSEARRQP